MFFVGYQIMDTEDTAIVKRMIRQHKSDDMIYSLTAFAHKDIRRLRKVVAHEDRMRLKELVRDRDEALGMDEFEERKRKAKESNDAFMLQLANVMEPQVVVA